MEDGGSTVDSRGNGMARRGSIWDTGSTVNSSVEDSNGFLGARRLLPLL